MIASPDSDQILAMAGVSQSAKLVYQMSKQDRHDESALRSVTDSLFKLDAKTTEQVYESVYSLDLGLRTIVALFANRPDASSRDIYQYAVAMHQLSTKLMKLQKTSNVIRDGLLEIEQKFSGEDETRPDELYESVAGLYSRTISYLTPRIIVHGVSGKLQDSNTVNRVRTALFAGIRSAYLWHQLGGRRWHLLLRRKDYVTVARRLLVT